MGFGFASLSLQRRRNRWVWLPEREDEQCKNYRLLPNVYCLPLARTMAEELITADNVDLSNCDREQIQFCGAVQPHALLLVVQERDLRVVQASANTLQFLHLAPTRAAGQPLAALLGDGLVAVLQQRLVRERLEAAPQHIVRATVGGQSFHVFAQRDPGQQSRLLLELEVIDAETPAQIADLYSELRGSIAKLQATPTLAAFFDLAVEQIRRFTDFDRVLAYKFLGDGSGVVTAEARSHADLISYLGLHFPAADIPAPARRLFALSWLRHLPDVNYTPVPLVPERDPQSGAPVDLSYVASRSVSVMYSGYLKNMGVGATMVMTLLKDGKLWGLISCMQHGGAKHVPYEVRLACEFLAHMVSLLMAAKEDAEHYGYRLSLAATVAPLVAAMGREDNFVDGLLKPGVNLLTTIDAGGAAVAYGEAVRALGAAPAPAQISRLVEWLSQRDEEVFATHELARLDPAASFYRELASGVLAVRLSRRRSDYLLWFRPEILQSVHWAGDPGKPVEVDQSAGEMRLTPRKSFELWQETRRGTSKEWLPAEVQYAGDLRRAIVEVVLGKAEEIKRMNEDLQRSNVELETFSYAASHDLREPLRGIQHMASFLEESAGAKLNEDERYQLATIKRLTQRMDELIESLLRYSRAGSTALELEDCDVKDVVMHALDGLRQAIEASRAKIELQAEFPKARCDRVGLLEVLQNLISNAVKYNDKPVKRVEVGWLPGSPPVFCVRDNGIGVAREQHERIFAIFRRLHGRDAFGGGTGAGLTIARRIVERHGGRIWLESTLGEGSTFYFTLAA